MGSLHAVMLPLRSMRLNQTFGLKALLVAGVSLEVHILLQHLVDVCNTCIVPQEHLFTWTSAQSSEISAM